MENCFENIRIEDLTECINEELISGISQTEVYVAISDHIKFFPPLTILTKSSPLEHLGQLRHTVGFFEKKGFFRLHVQTDTGEVKGEVIGNKGNKKFKNTFEFFLTNASARNAGFMRQFRNAPLVFIVRQKTGVFSTIGSKISPAYFDEVSWTTGKVEEDSGWQVSVSAISASPAPIYIGAFTLFDTTKKRAFKIDEEVVKSK